MRDFPLKIIDKKEETMHTYEKSELLVSLLIISYKYTYKKNEAF